MKGEQKIFLLLFIRVLFLEDSGFLTRNAGSKVVSGKNKFCRRKKNKNKKNRNGRKNKNKNKQNKNKTSVIQNAEALANELSRQGKSAIGPSLNFLTTSKNPSVEPLLKPQPDNPKIRTSNSRSFDFRTGRQTNLDKVVVPGFPNGLPNGVPEGVKIALANARAGKNVVKFI